MIRGCGVDLVAIARVAAMADKGLTKRFFTDEERAYVAGRGALAAESTAGIFAAKEAMLKALGTGIAGIGLSHVAVAHTALGAPVGVLTGPAAERLAALGASRMHLSITHAEGMAIAVAIAEGEDNP